MNIKTKISRKAKYASQAADLRSIIAEKQKEVAIINGILDPILARKNDILAGIEAMMIQAAALEAQAAVSKTRAPAARCTRNMPAFYEFFGPVMAAINDLGGNATTQAINDYVIRDMGISKRQLRMPLSERNRNRTLFGCRVNWARTYLKKYGLIDSPERNEWMATPAGRRVRSVSKSQTSAICDYYRSQHTA